MCFHKGGSTYYVIQKFSDLRPPPSEASSCVIFGTKKSNIYIIRYLIQKSSKTPLNSQNFSRGASHPRPPPKKKICSIENSIKLHKQFSKSPLNSRKNSGGLRPPAPPLSKCLIFWSHNDRHHPSYKISNLDPPL